MGQVLEIRVEAPRAIRKDNRYIDEYCDYVLYLYLARFEPDKFKRTALYIDEPENYPKILEKYEEKLDVLPPKTRFSILDRLTRIEYMYAKFDLFDGMRDYHEAAVYFSRRFLLVVDKPFPQNATTNKPTMISLIKGKKIS